MIRTILAAAFALAVCACTSRSDNWGALSSGVGHVLNADPAAAKHAE